MGKLNIWVVFCSILMFFFKFQFLRFVHAFKRDIAVFTESFLFVPVFQIH